MDPKDQRLVQQSLNQALTQVGALRKQILEASRTLKEKEREFQVDSKPDNPEPEKQADARPADTDDFMPQLTEVLRRLTGDCNCPQADQITNFPRRPAS